MNQAEEDALVAEFWQLIDVNNDAARIAIRAAYAQGREDAAKTVDHILKEGGGTYGDAIRREE